MMLMELKAIHFTNPGGYLIRIKKAPSLYEGALQIDSGGVLLSHAVPRAVPSALKSLTSVFGMGTGVSSSL